MASNNEAAKRDSKGKRGGTTTRKGRTTAKAVGDADDTAVVADGETIAEGVGSARKRPQKSAGRPKKARDTTSTVSPHKGAGKKKKPPQSERNHGDTIEGSADNHAEETPSVEPMPKTKKRKAVRVSAAKPKTPHVQPVSRTTPDDLLPSAAQSEQSELALMRAQLKQEADARRKAEEELAKLQKAADRDKRTYSKSEMIPKPYGTAGKHYLLREAMGLKDDKDTVRKVVIQGGLDFKVGIRQQHPATLGAVYELARDAQPYLSRFINDWATAQIIIQYLANRRKDRIEHGNFVVTTDSNGRRIVKDATKRIGRIHAKVPSVIDCVAQAASARKLAQHSDLENLSDDDSDNSDQDDGGSTNTPDFGDPASISDLDGEDEEDGGVLGDTSGSEEGEMASGASKDGEGGAMAAVEGGVVRVVDPDDLPLPPAKKRKLAHVPAATS
ncbi:hypothetical protein C8Q79DRAFT_1006417 [Trametes meyenii]|nr:hypothetical protein C8Q79DRAFT_1006417 [Trametes meyenii]